MNDRNQAILVTILTATGLLAGGAVYAAALDDPTCVTPAGVTKAIRPPAPLNPFADPLPASADADDPACAVPAPPVPPNPPAAP